MLALLLLLATYAGIVAAVGWLVSYRPHYALYGIAVGVGLSVSIAARYRSASGSLVRTVGAREATREDHADLLDAVGKLATLAGVPAPRLYVAPTDAPNAFSVGLRQRASAVVVTEGLLQRLDERKLGTRWRRRARSAGRQKPEARAGPDVSLSRSQRA